jgi:hypothetical protein
MDKELQHDTAVAMAYALLEVMDNCLMEMERRDAFEEFYQICRAGVEAYALHQNWINLRIDLEGN